MNTRTSNYTWEMIAARAVEPEHYAWRWERENRRGVNNMQTAPASRHCYDGVPAARTDGFETEAPRGLR